MITSWYWAITPGRTIQFDDRILFYPFDYVTFIQSTFGSDVALDQLKIIMHSYIDKLKK